MAIRDSVVDRTIRFEGLVDHLYKDTLGYVTIGIGFLVPTEADAVALPLRKRADQALADDAEKRAAFQLITAAEPGHAAAWYQATTNVFLPTDDSRAILKTKLEASERELEAIFGPAYSAYPEPAQDALIDIIYNVGRPRFNQFQKLINAARQEAWSVAALESNRPAVGQARNLEVRALFERAAEMTSISGLWVMAATVDGQVIGNINIQFTQVGSDAYTGRMTAVGDNGPIAADLADIHVTPGRHIVFRIPDQGEVDEADFQGTINADYRSIVGVMMDDGDIIGTFEMHRR